MRTAFTTLNMAVLAPIPSAMITSATAVYPGLRAMSRRPYRRSKRSSFMIPSPLPEVGSL